MLDVNFESIFKIEAVFPEPKIESDAIILYKCRVFDGEQNAYSEVDEGSYCLLNLNDGFGEMKIEFSFSNADKYFYKNYYVNCVAIRTNFGVIYKTPAKFNPRKCYSKITKDGKFAIGLSYYFHNKNEIEELLNSEQFIIEFSLAINNPKNTYQIVCNFVKSEKGWKLKDGNTYRIYKNKHINSYIH